jgi:colicin import membrane protein
MSTLLLNPRQMYAPDPEQQPVAAGVLTVVVHVLFAAVLFLNMSWQQKIRPQASVKLWEAMPTTPAKAMPATPVKAERARKRKPVTPAKPEFQPAPDQLRTPITQAAPVAISPAVPPPPAPRIDIAPAQTIAPLRADLAAPKREHVAKPVPDSTTADSAEPPPTYTPTQIVDVSQPDRAQIAASRADLATPTRERIDIPAPDSVNVEPFEPPPEYAPKKIVDVSQTVEPQIAPPGTDLAAPQRQPVEKAPASVSSAPVEPLPKYTPTTIEQQPGRKPEIDVDALRRDRALALAEQLREEEDSRLNESLDRERVERKEEAKKRREEREAKLARELQEISAAARQRVAELQAQQAQDAAAQSLADDYRARISAKIRQRVILPPDMRGNPQAIYEVSLLPGGEVTQVRLLQSSGVLTYDAAVERAILAAQPLPVPEDPELFHAIFKNFFLSFRPKE